MLHDISNSNLIALLKEYRKINDNVAPAYSRQTPQLKELFDDYMHEGTSWLGAWQSVGIKLSSELVHRIVTDQMLIQD